MGIKFANLPRVTVKDARWINMPYGKFLCKFYDTRSADYAKAQMKAVRPHRVELQNMTLDSAIDREITARVFIECSLCDWKDVLDEDGKQVPFSVENALELFANPENARVFYDVVDEASAVANFRITDAERKN